MASKGLQMLIDRLGEKDAEIAYNLVIDDYTAHVRKHALAAKADTPGKASEADVLLGILDRVDADDTKLTLEIVTTLDGKEGVRDG